jgi:hypothetical protein
LTDPLPPTADELAAGGRGPARQPVRDSLS